MFRSDTIQDHVWGQCVLPRLFSFQVGERFHLLRHRFEDSFPKMIHDSTDWDVTTITLESRNLSLWAMFVCLFLVCLFVELLFPLWLDTAPNSLLVKAQKRCVALCSLASLASACLLACLCIVALLCPLACLLVWLFWVATEIRNLLCVSLLALCVVCLFVYPIQLHTPLTMTIYS